MFRKTPSAGFTWLERLKPFIFVKKCNTESVKANRLSGFTLMELLVVIAIIGILATIVMVSLSDVRSKGKNSSQIQQVKEYQKALELYRAFNNSQYPNMGNTCLGDYDDDLCWNGGNVTERSGLLMTALQTYMKVQPPLKTFGGIEGGYYSIIGGTNASRYTIRWMMEGGGGDVALCNIGSEGIISAVAFGAGNAHTACKYDSK